MTVWYTRLKTECRKKETNENSQDFFRNLSGDMTRIKILCVLFQASSCVCDLAEVVGMTQSAVSHQLRILKQMKLVKNRREGKTVFYSLADGHIQSILNQGMKHK